MPASLGADHANADRHARRIHIATADDLRRDLTHAVTRYDRAQARGRSYNPHALGIYLSRVDDIVARFRRGEAVQAAIAGELSDRLLDRTLIYMREQGWPVAPTETR